MRLSFVALALIGLISALSRPSSAQTTIQLQCSGTLLESSGESKQSRSTDRLAVSLGLKAEELRSDLALVSLQKRMQ